MQPELLQDVRAFLAGIEDYSVANLTTKLESFAAARQMKINDINHVLRVATTGVGVGVGVFETLAIFGREETLRRLDMAQKQTT